MVAQFPRYMGQLYQLEGLCVYEIIVELIVVSFFDKKRKSPQLALGAREKLTP